MARGGYVRSRHVVVCIRVTACRWEPHQYFLIAYRKELPVSEERRADAIDSGPVFVLRTLGDAQLCRASTDATTSVSVQLVGKQFALVAFLACSPKRAASRILITSLFAPEDAAERQAGDAVRDLIRQLRTKLGRDALGEHGDDPVRLAAPIACDRDALLDAWRRRDFDDVVALYSGPFLPRCETIAGPDLAHWVETERADLGRRFAQAARHVLTDRLAAASDDRRMTETAVIARRLRDHAPLEQDAWRFLIRSLVLAGEHDEAAVEAEHLRVILESNRIQADSATRNIIALARSQQTSASANAQRISGSPAVGAPSPGLMVGRELELATLFAAWDRARAGMLVHVHIAGPAGLGKSRLLLEIRQRLRARPPSAGGTRPIEAKAAQSDRDTPFALLTALAGRLAEHPGGAAVSESVAGRLVELNPALVEVYKSARTRPSGPPTSGAGLVAALQELVGALALDGPVALLLDDLHWSDPESARILGDVLTGCAELPMLVVTTGRDSGDALRAITHGKQVELAPLDVAAISQALTRLAPLPDEGWAQQLPALLWHATAGNPLLLSETLRLLAEASLLSVNADEWVTTDVPALFEQLRKGNATRRRIEHLTPSERRLLLLLAVHGTALPTRRLRAAANQEIAEFNSALTSLEKRGLAVRRADEWSVAHDEHSASVRDATSPSDIADASARLGRTVYEDAQDDLRDLRHAGTLLAIAGDSLELRAAFVRYVRLARGHGEARQARILAEEFLGRQSSDRQLVASCVRQLPLAIRVDRKWRSSITVAAGVAVLGAIVLVIGAMLRPAALPDAVLAFSRPSQNRRAVDFSELRLDASHWAGVRVIDATFDNRRWQRANLLGNGGYTLRPDHRGWTGGVSVADSGVIDVFDFDTKGHATRLTFESRDDLQPSWAPDNSRFVYVTARWSRGGHYDLAIRDILSRTVQHLTQGDDTDDDPHWSPDGSRIAFIRHDASWRSKLCVVDVNGENLDCFHSDTLTQGIAGWADEHRVWLRRGTGGGDGAIERLDLSTRTVDATIPRDFGASISPDGRFAVCQCPRRGQPLGTWIAYPIDRPDEFAILRVADPDPAMVEFSWAPTTPRARYLARLSIDTGLGPPILGASHQLRASGVDSSNRVVSPGVVRWRSENPAVAEIDSAGLLTPRDTGLVTIDATAGGWRSTRTGLRIVRPESHVLLDEDWSKGLKPYWESHGVPRPVVVPDARLGRAFLNNGDGAFFSGAYTSAAFQTSGGLWVDAKISTPITAAESQDLLVSLFPMTDSVRWARWDHVTGDGPPGLSSSACGIRYPVGLRTKHFGEELWIFGQGPAARARMPDDAYTGRPFRLTMQLFPDGRCALAIDGKLVWSDTAKFNQQHVHLWLQGNTVDTKILVGPVRVGSGIAPDIDWNPKRVP